MIKNKSLKIAASVLIGLGFVFIIIGIVFNVFNIKSKKDSNSSIVEANPQEL